MQPQPSIAIIGAGPSGLLLARLLEVHGIKDYIVYEKDESSVPGPWQLGGSLDLHAPSGQLALKKAGLFEEFDTVYARRDACEVHLLDTSGVTIARFGEGRDAPEIDRLQLRQFLLNSIPAHKVRWGHAVQSIERNTNGSNVLENACIIHFLNGSSAIGFKLIVGADGGWSKVRPLLSPAQPVYSGKMYIEGKISHDNPSYEDSVKLSGSGSMMAMGPKKNLVLQQMADGTYRIYFGAVAPEDFYQHRGGSATEKSEAIRKFMLSSDEFYANWAPQLRALGANAEGPFRGWGLYQLRPEEVGWERKAAPGVTLLGDAAHLSTPFVGEGINCALYDALLLSERLLEVCGQDLDVASLEKEKLENALLAYEKDMFERGSDLIRRSEISGDARFSENPVESVLRILDGDDETLVYDFKRSGGH